MATVSVESGICGFTTNIRTESADMQNVKIEWDSDCPHIQKAGQSLVDVDAYQELFKKPADTSVYAALAPHLPHVTCPVYSAFLKAIEVAAGLALPKDVAIKIEA